MSLRVLLVDDEDDVREVAQTSLELVGGWDVAAASSGAQGIELAVEHKFDVILLDVMMPGIDGPSTLEELRRRPETQSTPVIFLTAKVQTSERRQLGELGVHGVIAKPFDPLTLPQQVTDLLSAA